MWDTWEMVRCGTVLRRVFHRLVNVNVLYAGNFHALILFQDDTELKAVSDAVHRLVQRAIALDGTCACHFPARSGREC